ncbi:hypothetical protein JCM11251_003480 [Rhodosporidiobolus azoricus]
MPQARHWLEHGQRVVWDPAPLPAKAQLLAQVARWMEQYAPIVARGLRQHLGTDYATTRAVILEPYIARAQYEDQPDGRAEVQAFRDEIISWELPPGQLNHWHYLSFQAMSAIVQAISNESGAYLPQVDDLLSHMTPRKRTMYFVRTRVMI